MYDSSCALTSVFFKTMKNHVVVFWVATLHEHTVIIIRVEVTSENFYPGVGGSMSLQNVDYLQTAWCHYQEDHNTG
jgi:hypothetical protein